MELKLTTKRALEFEEKTGKDLIVFVQEIGETGKITVKDMLSLFEAMGENYTIEVFDAWDADFMTKSTAIMNAVKAYMGVSGKAKK